MVVNWGWNSSFIQITLHCSFSTKALRHAIHLKTNFASWIVALATSTTPSEEIPSCSWMSTWSMTIFFQFFLKFQKKKKKKKNLMLLRKSYNCTRLKKTTMMVSKRWWGWMEVHTTHLKTIRPCWRYVACRAQCLTSNNVNWLGFLGMFRYIDSTHWTKYTRCVSAFEIFLCFCHVSVKKLGWKSRCMFCMFSVEKQREKKAAVWPLTERKIEFDLVGLYFH